MSNFPLLDEDEDEDELFRVKNRPKPTPTWNLKKESGTKPGQIGQTLVHTPTNPTRNCNNPIKSVKHLIIPEPDLVLGLADQNHASAPLIWLM